MAARVGLQPAAATGLVSAEALIQNNKQQSL